MTCSNKTLNKFLLAKISKLNEHVIMTFINYTNQTKYMNRALETAKNSGHDIPVGAIIVKNGKIIAAAHNEKESLNDVSAHAEIQVIRKASALLKNWRLDGCEMYVTLEPCPMCTWAIMQSRISRLYFGSYDTVYGGFSVLYELKKIANSPLVVKGGILESECNSLINSYFERMR